jgi:asparagine synthase (glutamine-hydrolysing)
LRTLAKRYLPELLIHQPKRGFEIPLKSWVNGQLKDIIHDYLGDANAYHKNLLQKGFIEKLLADQINMPSEKRAKILWTVFSLEVWYKKVYLS